jgi:hypothetical protein
MEPDVLIRFGRHSPQVLPDWARWLIDLGRLWRPSGSRGIALVSMPCDSPGAGLVALGALVADLADSRASDLEGHFDSLIRYAKQYLDYCRMCDSRCRPIERRCGYTAEASGKLRHVSGKLIGPIIGFEDQDTRLISLNVGTGTVHLFPAASQSYYEHRAPPIVARAGDSLDPVPYLQLARGSVIDAEQFGKTFSGTCLAGHIMGEAGTRNSFVNVLFECNGRKYSLAELLTIQGWGTNSVSRMTFFNTRTGMFDRDSSFNRLVVADGHGALDKVLSTKEFNRSDVIAVLNRTAADETSRILGGRIASMRQWYSVDKTRFFPEEQIPRGIAIQVIRRIN